MEERVIIKRYYDSDRKAVEDIQLKKCLLETPLDVKTKKWI